MQFSPVHLYFLLYMPKHSPTHPILSLLQCSSLLDGVSMDHGAFIFGTQHSTRSGFGLFFADDDGTVIF